MGKTVSDSTWINPFWAPLMLFANSFCTKIDNVLGKLKKTNFRTCSLNQTACIAFFALRLSGQQSQRPLPLPLPFLFKAGGKTLVAFAIAFLDIFNASAQGTPKAQARAGRINYNGSTCTGHIHFHILQSRRLHPASQAQRTHDSAKHVKK